MSNTDHEVETVSDIEVIESNADTIESDTDEEKISNIGTYDSIISKVVEVDKMDEVLRVMKSIVKALESLDRNLDSNLTVLNKYIKKANGI